MLRNSLVPAIALVAMVALLGCNDANLDSPSGADLATEMAALVLETDQMTEDLVGGELNAMAVAVAPITEQRSFSLTRPCAGGGVFRVDGNIIRTSDPATGVVEADISGSRSRMDCVYTRGDFTITVNSSAMWELFRRRVNGMPDGPQTSHFSGSWTAERSDGEVRTCSFDFTVVRDPDAQTRTVNGTLCAGGLHRAMGWNPN